MKPDMLHLFSNLFYSKIHIIFFNHCFFFQHLYSVVHEKVQQNSTAVSDIQGNMFGRIMKSEGISRNTDLNVCVKKPNPNSDELINFITCLETYHSFERKSDSLVKTREEFPNVKPEIPDNYSGMSIEEIDRNYQVLKLQDVECTSFDIGFGNRITQSDISDSSSPTDALSGFSSKKIKYDDDFLAKNDENRRYIEETETCFFNDGPESKFKDPYSSVDYPTVPNPALNCKVPKGFNYANLLYSDDDLLTKKNVSQVYIEETQMHAFCDVPKNTYLDVEYPAFSDKTLEKINTKPVHYKDKSNHLKGDNISNIYSKDTKKCPFNDITENQYPRLEYPTGHSPTFKCESPEIIYTKPPHYDDENDDILEVRNINHRKDSQTYSFTDLTKVKNFSQNLTFPAFNSKEAEEIGFSTPLHYNEKHSSSPKTETRKLDLSRYKYKKKRLVDDDFFTQNKFMKYSMSNSLPSASPRLQKGRSSKTVCKKVSFQGISPSQCTSLQSWSLQPQTPRFTDDSNSCSNQSNGSYSEELGKV